jgi:hypothetical protein
MPLVKNVEKRIWDLEGFDVVIRGSDGHNVRGDRRGLPQYPYDRAAKNEITVEAWKATRFRPTYPGFDVDVLNAASETVAGNTKLATVRDTYSED